MLDFTGTLFHNNILKQRYRTMFYNILLEHFYSRFFYNIDIEHFSMCRERKIYIPPHERIPGIFLDMPTPP
jgi:hypothetical protein